MNLLVLSDIHGNLSALESVLAQASAYPIDAYILLGDLIDYGMRSNEVLQRIEDISYPCLSNIWGNHEYAIRKGDDSGFSSPRGQLCARYTRSILNEASLCYLDERMLSAGKQEFLLEGRRCLAVHGSATDPYWGTITPGIVPEDYREYDYVFSGHSHVPHFFEAFFPADDPAYRNKKKTAFLNPGSVGQPRNLCPMAQYAVLDTESGQAFLMRTSYDIQKEQEIYTGQVDDFYRERLAYGI